MNKRTFLKLLSAPFARSVIAPLPALAAKQKLTNWAGNLSYSTNRLREASSVEQIQSVLRSQDKVKVRLRAAVSCGGRQSSPFSGRKTK
jgi:xylitol oxidase